MSFRNHRAALPALLLCAALAGCAGTGTGYHERTVLGELFLFRQGGYEVEQLGPEDYRVVYEAGMSNPEARSRKFVLYRCATLALEKGARGFRLDQPVDLVKAPMPMHKLLYGARVRLLADPQPDGRLVFDAAQVVKELDPFIAQFR